jgi:hypothetical protein
MSEHQKNMLRNSDPFFHISGFLKHLSTKFALYFVANQKIDIDEMCIGFKGRHRCRCYNPNKPNKFHLKAFCLNDSTTGYLLSFYMYHGACEVRPPGMSATYYPVYKLTEDVKYHDINHVLSTDNWYTGLPVTELCFTRGMHSNGTCKSNKQNLPQDSIFKKTGPNKKNRGDMKCMVAVRDGKTYYFTAWQDNKPVHMLSTYKPYYTTIQRNSLNAQNQYCRININRPTVIGDYNKGMGGTDLMDQKCSYYNFEHRTVKYYHRLISHFLMVATVNSYILWKHENEHQQIDLKGYIFLLMKELAGDKHDDEFIFDNNYLNELEDNDGSESDDKPCKRVKGWLKDTSRVVPTHTPSFGDDRGLCMGGCGSKVKSKCIECNAFLCMRDTGHLNCWWKFHNTREIS